MSKYLDDMEKYRRQLRDISRKLNTLADASWQMGNDRLSDNLAVMSSTLDDIQRCMNVTVSEELDRTLKQAEEASGNMMQAVLAGIHVEREGGKKI